MGEPRSAISLLIGDPLADDAGNGLHRAFCVCDLQCRALIVAEIKLRKVALEVLGADVVVRAGDPPLHNREVTLDGVGVHVTADVFANRMVDCGMVRELTANASAAVIGHDIGCLVDLLAKDRAEGLAGYVRNVVRSHPAAALDERQDNLLAPTADVASIPLAAVLVLFLSADIRLVKLDGLALAAQRPGRLQIAHALADAVRHKPRRLVGKAKHPVKLVGADALLAGTHKVRGEKPFRHRDVRPLVNRADLRRELAPAVLAVVPAWPHRLAAQRLHRVELPAVRAVRAVRPADRLEVGARRIRVDEDRVREVNGGGHGISP